MSQHATITRRFTQAIVQAARRLDISLPEALAARLESERVDLADQDQLWETFCAASGDPLAGLRLGLEIQVGHLDSVGMLLMSCETLGDAIEMLLEYSPIVGDAADFSLDVTTNEAAIAYHPRYRVRRAQRVEAVFACLLNLTRWTTGHAFQPTRLQLSHPAHAPTEVYQELLDCPVAFEQTRACLSFSIDQLTLPLIQANSTAREHLKTLADQMLEELTSQDFGDQLAQLIRQQPGWGRERIAAQLAMSGRHLNRKLAAHGLSFKALREQILFHMAGEALRDQQPAEAVAEQLGFSDESAFSRAFKRWSGMTPAQFRQARPTPQPAS